MGPSGARDCVRHLDLMDDNRSSRRDDTNCGLRPSGDSALLMEVLQGAEASNTCKTKNQMFVDIRSI